MSSYKWMLCIALLLPLPAQAFTLLTDGMRGWSGETVRFRLNPGSCDVSTGVLTAAIERAVDLWNSVPSSKLKLEYAGTTGDSGSQNPPVIECDPAFGSTSTVGVGSVVTDGGGTIVSGRIRLNAQSGSAGDIATKSTTTLEIIMAHEMGHVLGIGHTPAESALMHFSVGQKENLSMAQDDMDALSYLYPREEPLNGQVFGCGTLGDGPGGANALANWAALLLVMIAGFALRLRSAT